MLDRKLAYVGVAFGVILAVALSLRWRAAHTVEAERVDAEAPTDASSAPAPLRMPTFEEVELGVLTGPVPVRDRALLAAQLGAALCGDETACAPVRATLLDPAATFLDETNAAFWLAPSIDAGIVLDAGGAGRVLTIVRVRCGSSPRHLALRTAVAAAAALAALADGRVVDPVSGRVDDARTLTADAVTEPLGAPVFRRDRVRVVEAPNGDGVVRLRTAGMKRWGAPDIELAAVPETARAAASELLLLAAADLTTGSPEPRVTIATRSARGDLGSADDSGAASETPGHVEIDLASVDPGPNDPDAFLARIEAPGGEGPVAALELVERVLGPWVAAAPDETVARTRASNAQRELARLLESGGSPLHDAPWSDAETSDAGALWVRLPFPIPGGGNESLWVRVTRHDASTVTGRIDDDPLAATDVARGETVRRPRSDVEAVRIR